MRPPLAISPRRDASPEQIARVERLALSVSRMESRARHEYALVLADLVEEVGWPREKNIIPTGRAGIPERWGVRSLDVWGNPEDGFEVNETFRAGTIVVPTKEVLYNVTAYRDSYGSGFREQRPGRPLLRMISVEHVMSRDDLWRRFKKEFLASTVKRSQIDFEEVGDGYIEVSVKKTAEPLFFLEREA